MAHTNQRTVEVGQCLLQHVLGAQVQVIRRFVKNQQVHRFEQQFEQSQARTFATRKHLHLFGAGLAAKHERTEQVANFIANFALRHIVDGLEHGQFLIQQRSLILGKVSNFYVVAQRQRTLVFKLAHDTLHHGRFTLAVTSDEGHLFASFNGH